MNLHKKIFFLLALGILCVEADSDKSVLVNIYPGFGWDDLRFLDLSPIFDVSNFNSSLQYQSCIEILPVYQNKFLLDSTVIDMFDARSNDYSSNLFISGGGSFWKVSVQGSYSQEYQSSKKQQGEENTIAIRNQIEYIMYDVILTSTCKLNPQVKQALIDISRYQTNDQHTMAKYAAQLFIKMYGTHFTSRLSLGGSIVQEDHIKKSIYYENNSQTKKYRASASASFLSTYKLSTSYDSTSTDTSIRNLTKEFTRKVVQAKGGKLDLSSGAIESWQASIDSKPAIIRRAIENITSFIHSDKIPELSEIELENVRDELNAAIETYVEMNTYKGCMNRTSPSFNWVANVDDNACSPAEKNSQFGGFIRTCTEDSRISQKCNQYRLKNSYTGIEECPINFDKYLLRQTIQNENIFKHECHRCKLYTRRCCNDIFVGVGQRIIKFYGCNSRTSQLRASTGLLQISNNYVYGGSFTNDKVNPVIGYKGCPNEQFQTVSITDNLRVCLSERIADTDGLPHYGGIYSCDQGNIAYQGKEKECPTGYSSYVMNAIDENCLLYVCLKFNSFPEIRQIPSIVLPPFFSILLPNQTINLTVSYSEDTNTESTTKVPEVKHDSFTYGLSIGGIAIGVLLTLAVTFLIIQNKRLQNQVNQRNYIPIQ